MPNQVLLVEDEPVTRALMATILASQGFPAALAENGREALDYLLSSAAPSVILLDLMMPVMSGWEFLAAKALVPSLVAIPVVVVSACSDYPAGTVGTLHKPVDFGELRGTLKRYCTPDGEKGPPPA